MAGEATEEARLTLSLPDCPKAQTANTNAKRIDPLSLFPMRVVPRACPDMNCLSVLPPADDCGVRAAPWQIAVFCNRLPRLRVHAIKRFTLFDTTPSRGFTTQGSWSV